MINEEALNFMPSRHYSAYIIGLFPSIYDWVTTVSKRDPIASDTGDYNVNTPGLGGWIGVLAWKRGALLVSMLWVAMVVNVLDRQWKLAGIWALVATFFATFGIIHVPEAGFENFSDPTTEQCIQETAGIRCWDYGQQWMFVVAYLTLTATFALIYLASNLDESMADPIDDESRHAFDDWFKDAAKDTSVHKNEKDPDPTAHAGKEFDDDYEASKLSKGRFKEPDE
jgi:AGZA family xanthine/uracil permease-like MFS transporter